MVAVLQNIDCTDNRSDPWCDFPKVPDESNISIGPNEIMILKTALETDSGEPVE